ncbi:MAG TPA: carbohydrate kinase family protein [Intrasporangium sp.]|uniref:carbohydrate kinase family protein n=1 Tax=Intrasporangium sp. TaxID=1925024 RepID=UPI002D78F9D5|nr:carbohydrate kinase family protein [Intrasporangium sp.]HET7397205.1 carbohydrate kinase family protein [Intrasporangium sp.]
MPETAFDPLASRRGPGTPPFDVFVWGTVYLDIIFAGLTTPPAPGTEVWAEGMASCPGGIANLAVAAQRLGLRTSLAAAFSDDDYGDFCWRTLEEQEGIDLSRSQRFPDWHSPVTVSMSVNRDRSMVSHGHPAPVDATELIGIPPCSRAVLVDLAEASTHGGSAPTWVDLAREQGALVFAGVGWDPGERWAEEVLARLDHCHAFLPNAVEAMAYTGTSTAQEALYALADRVPVAIVTQGSDGAIGIDSTTGEEAAVPSLRVPPLDPTGAGDVFGAAILVGTLAGWPLVDRMTFASLCSALAIQQFGGSLAAPGWGDVLDWWHVVRAAGRDDAYHRSLRRRFAFLDDIAPTVPPGVRRRATATIARRADVNGLQ